MTKFNIADKSNRFFIKVDSSLAAKRSFSNKKFNLYFTHITHLYKFF